MSEFEAGHILFQDLGCGAVCDAINGVTPGWRGAEINHCGIVASIDGRPVVLEAIYPSVRATRLEDFLRRSLDERNRPRCLRASLKRAYQDLVPEALRHAANRIGVPYDPQFAPDGAALYCSELLVVAFRHANNGANFFPERPMTFVDPKTGQPHAFWVRYYAALGVRVPEGEIGSNPGDLSLSDKLSRMTQLGSLRGLPLA